MSKCLTCGETVEQKKGKRKRLYCSDLCRVRHFQRNGKRDSKKPQITPQAPAAPVDPNQAILKQIAAIKAEPVPQYRNTVLGRRSWDAEQRQRIIELESKLKNQ